MHAPKENCSKIKEPYDDPVGVEIGSVKFPAKINCNEEHSLPHPWLTHTDRNNQPLNNLAADSNEATRYGNEHKHGGGEHGFHF